MAKTQTTQTGSYRYLSIGQLKAKNYETIDLGERFRPLLGLLQTKFVIMMYGTSGCGKSVFTIQLCQELSIHPVNQHYSNHANITITSRNGVPVHRSGRT